MAFKIVQKKNKVFRGKFIIFSLKKSEILYRIGL